MLRTFQCFITNTSSKIFTLKGIRKSYLVVTGGNGRKKKLIRFSLFQIIALFGCSSGDLVARRAESCNKKNIKLSFHLLTNQKHKAGRNNNKFLIRLEAWKSRCEINKTKKTSGKSEETGRFLQWKLFPKACRKRISKRRKRAQKEIFKETSIAISIWVIQWKKLRKIEL